MYEIPMGLGTVSDRTLSNVALAPEVLLLVVMSLGTSVVAFLAGVTDVVAKGVVPRADIGQTHAA